MRAIEVRGISVETGKLIYGYGCLANMDKYFIIQMNYLGQLVNCDEVDPETVGEYTGIDDVDGVKIFEGDEVLLLVNRFKFKGIVRYDADRGGFVMESSQRNAYLAKKKDYQYKTLGRAEAAK